MAARAFGRYAGIISNVRKLLPAQDEEAFHGSQLIESGIGYRWRKSKLLLAQKEATPTSGKGVRDASRNQLINPTNRFAASPSGVARI